MIICSESIQIEERPVSGSALSVGGKKGEKRGTERLRGQIPLEMYFSLVCISSGLDLSYFSRTSTKFLEALQKVVVQDCDISKRKGRFDARDRKALFVSVSQLQIVDDSAAGSDHSCCR